MGKTFQRNPCYSYLKTYAAFMIKMKLLIGFCLIVDQVTATSADCQSDCLAEIRKLCTKNGVVNHGCVKIGEYKCEVDSEHGPCLNLKRLKLLKREMEDRNERGGRKERRRRKEGRRR